MFTALSGRPINVLGIDPTYGLAEVFILPRGSGGRSPTVVQLDLHLAYEIQLSVESRFSLSVDFLNLFNQQEATNVDDVYSFSPTSPIVYGKPEDLHLQKDRNGARLQVNSNYGQPTAFQDPLFLRLGLRWSF